MAETSYFWGGTTIGDAGPYADTTFTTFFKNVFQMDPDLQGPLMGQENDLQVALDSGVTIQLKKGSALVEGKLYINSANIDYELTAPGAGTYYYTVILRKDFAAQTVRADILGPDNAIYPAVTQADGTTWEIELARVSVTAAPVVTITDTRHFCQYSTVLSPVNFDDDAFPYTSTGDLAYQSASKVLSKIGIGAGGTILTPEAGIPVWRGYSGAYVYRSTVQSLSDNTLTAISSFDTVRFDTDDYYEELDEYFTVPATGLYFFGCSGYFSGHASPGTLRKIGIKRGPAVLVANACVQDTGSGDIELTCCSEYLLSIGDEIRMFAEQRSGASIDFNAAIMYISRSR